MNAIDVVIMAAGQGTRMKSRVPKVLHRLAGRPLLQHVLAAVSQLQVRQVVVVTGNGAVPVEAAVGDWVRAGECHAPLFARQEPQLGTGHAVQQAAPLLSDDGTTLILNGDVPLIEAVATHDEEQETLTFFAVNRSQGEPIHVAADVRSLPGYGVVEHIVLEHDDPKARNSADCPNQVAPHNHGNAELRDGRMTAVLPKLSWNVIRMAREI